MNLRNFTHVIFDFDHTLARLVINWDGWSEGIAKIALKFNPDFQYDGFVSYQNINELTKTYGEKIRLEMLAFNVKYEAENLQKIIPNPTALKVLRNLKKQQKAYLLTSNARKTILPLLAQLNITDLFQKIITREDATLIKPDPFAFGLIATDDVPLSKYVMIGDSSADEGFAHNVGIAFVHVDELA